MSDSTFTDLYCAKNELSSEEFARSIFSRTLYRRTMPIVWLLRFFKPNHFAADFDLIYGVAHLRRMRDFSTEARRFNEHPANTGFLRRWMCMRVSTHKLRQLIKETLPHTSGQQEVETGTAMPFEAPAKVKVRRPVVSRS